MLSENFILKNQLITFLSKILSFSDPYVYNAMSTYYISWARPVSSLSAPRCWRGSLVRLITGNSGLRLISFSQKNSIIH